MDSERFTYYPNSQMIRDNRTGDIYHGNKTITMLLNRNAEAFDEWYKVLHKYNIDSPKKLDQVLMNERVW
jgi:hypothetical protein